MAKRQSQDKPQTKIRVQTRRARLVKLFAEGMTVREAQKIINKEGIKASRALVGFDLQAIAREAPLCVEDARDEARVQLRGLRKIITNAKKLGLKDQVQLLLAIHDRYSRLLGLDAPAKSISAVVTPPPGVIAMDFGEPVEKTSDLVSEQEYLDGASNAKALKAIEE
jgi:hypothetical protein